MAVVTANLREFARNGDLTGRQVYGIFMDDDGNYWNGTAWVAPTATPYTAFQNLPSPAAGVNNGLFIFNVPTAAAFGSKNVLLDTYSRVSGAVDIGTDDPYHATTTFGALVKAEDKWTQLASMIGLSSSQQRIGVNLTDILLDPLGETTQGNLANNLAVFLDNNDNKMNPGDAVVGNVDIKISSRATQTSVDAIVTTGGAGPWTTAIVAGLATEANATSNKQEILTAGGTGPWTTASTTGLATEANATSNKDEILTRGSTGPWTQGTGTSTFDPATQAVNADRINGSANAAARLGETSENMWQGTVLASPTPTQTQFDASGFPQTQANYWYNNVIVFRSNSTAMPAKRGVVTASEHVSGDITRFTVADLVAEPAASDQFNVV